LSVAVVLVVDLLHRLMASMGLTLNLHRLLLVAVAVAALSMTPMLEVAGLVAVLAWIAKTFLALGTLHSVPLHKETMAAIHQQQVDLAPAVAVAVLEGLVETGR
jgi:hypothetical protein